MRKLEQHPFPEGLTANEETKTKAGEDEARGTY